MLPTEIFFFFSFAQVVVVAVIRVDKLLELVYSFVSDHIGYSKFLMQFSLFHCVYQGRLEGGTNNLSLKRPWNISPPIHSLTHPDCWTFALSISIVLSVCLMYLISSCYLEGP